MPTPRDLLRFHDNRKPHLSSDGSAALLLTRHADVKKNRYTRTVWHVPTDTVGAQTKLDLPRRAHSFAWLPDSHRISFLAPAETGKQVWVKAIGADSARKVTGHKGGVESYAFSPSGEQIAYTTSKTIPSSGETRSDSLRGVTVDMRSFRDRQLRSDKLAKQVRESAVTKTELWIENREGGEPVKVSNSLTVGDFQWDPTGGRLAITGVPLSWSKSWLDGAPEYRTDLYLYDESKDRLRRIHKGRQDTSHVWEGAISYSSPFWSPTGDRLGFLRTDKSDRFASVAEVGIYNVAENATRFVTSAENQELSNPLFHWVSSDTLLVEYTDQAKRGLYRLSLEDGGTRPVWTSRGLSAGFAFAADGRRAVWVQESTSHPPEVFTGQRPFDSARQISTLNDHLQSVWLPEAESVEWTSKDGTPVQGWLIRPGKRAATGPPPLLVHVHGGPGMVMANSFGPYRGWPYPMQVFAARGYAVFIPNYRQTNSFGQDFQRIDGLDEQPVDDILSGIEHLVSQGEADSSRIGIMGYSWGGRLAPLAAAEKPIFRAASIAEGVGLNTLSNYGQGSGWSARGVREYHVGGTPYEQSERYLRQSPVFRKQFTSTTPTLLEYGQNGEAIQGLELGRALWRQGTPHEVVIYPNTGHGLRKPAALLESMNRNLEWFNQWIQAGRARTSEAP